MSILNALTPAEKRFLTQALEQGSAKPVFENMDEQPEQQKEEELTLQEDIGGREENVKQQLRLPSIKKKRNKPKPPDAVDRFLQQLRSENELWDLVERSLEYPFMYRSDKNRALCLKMLRRIPWFQSSSESDLEVVATYMEIVRLPAKMGLAGDCPLPPGSGSGQLPKLSVSVVESSVKDDDSCAISFSNMLPNPSTVVNEIPVQALSSNLIGDRYVYVLLRGSVALRLPSILTCMDAFIEPYEMFALPLIMNALPRGSWYETTGDSMLLRLPRKLDIALDRLLGDIENTILKERVHFLRRQLRVKVFTYWTQEEYETFARSLVPLRLSWRQVVVSQGMDSDAMYFIKEGNCVVVRNVPFFNQQKQEKQISSSPLSSNTPLQQQLLRKRSDESLRKTSSAVEVLSQPSQQSLLPPMKLVEVVTLREGEFFGELGLLHHSVDWTQNLEIILSEQYWKDRLNNALCFPVDYTALEDHLPWLSAPCSSEDDSAAKYNNGTLKENGGVFPSTFFPRQATVYTRCPCVLYMLTHDRCRQLFNEREYAQLKEFAKGYPSCESIERQYEQQRKWAQYRKALVNNVLMESRSVIRKKQKLPHLQFR